MKINKDFAVSLIFVSIFITSAIACFVIWVLPYLNGDSEVRWGADSLDYILYYETSGVDQTLIQLGQNLFGPIWILWLVNGSHVGVFALNVAMFLIGWFLVTNVLNVNRLVFFCLLAINPMLFASILTINKEIISFLVIAFYSVYLAKKGYLWLTLALLAAFFVRWQYVFIILLFELVRSPLNPFAHKRLHFLLLFVFLISLVYPSFDAQLGGVTTEMVDEQQASTSFGLLEVANNIQKSYAYFMVVIPKILSNWFGNLPRVANLFFNIDQFDVSDIYNTFVITGHQAAMTIVFMLIVIKRRFALSNDLIFFSLIYSIVYSLGMFIQYRYYFPVYIAFCIVLSQNNLGCKGQVLRKSVTNLNFKEF
jgi:hypothetical protein